MFDDIVKEIKFKDVVKDLEHWIKSQSDSQRQFLTKEEINLHLLVLELKRIKKKLKAVENCLICVAIADPIEVIENSLNIIKGK